MFSIAQDLSLPLDFTPAAAGSRFISNAPNAIKDVLAKHNATVNLHHDGVLPCEDGWGLRIRVAVGVGMRGSGWMWEL